MKDKNIRRGVIESLNEKLKSNAQEIQHITKPISAGEKKKARQLIRTLRSFLELIDILIAKPTDKMLDLFQNTQGITYEVMEKARGIEERLQNVEDIVTSKEFDFFRKLHRKH